MGFAAFLNKKRCKDWDLEISSWKYLSKDLFHWQNAVSLCPASFCTPRPNLPVTPGISWPVNHKGNQLWIFTGRADAEAEAPIFWPSDAKSQLIGKDPDAGKDWRQEEKGMTEDEMVGWHNWCNGHEFEQTMGDSEGQGSLVGCSPWSHKESDTTEQLNNSNKRPVPPDSLEHRVPHSHPELPQGVLKVNSCTGFSLCRSRWQIPLASANL